MKKPRKHPTVNAQIPIQEMLNQLPRDCLGEFDFLSSVLYVDCTDAEYTSLVARREKLGSKWDAGLSKRDKLILETSMHEYFHYFQVLSSGYLFEIVMALMDALTETANRLKRDESDHARLASFGRIATYLLRTLRDRSEGSSLAPIDIIEGAAYYFQSRSLARAPNHGKMLKAMRSRGLAMEYRRAYEYATARVQNNAFDTFLTIAAHALQFTDPAAVFEKLYDHSARMRKTGETSMSTEALDAIVAQHSYIGTAVDVWKLRGEGGYPWYSMPLSKLSKSKSVPPAFFDEWQENLVKHLAAPPLAFRDGFRGDVGIPAMFSLLAQRSMPPVTLPYTGTSKEREGRAGQTRRGAAGRT